MEWYLVCIGYPVVFVTGSQVLLVLLTLADSNARMFKDTLLRAGLKAVGSLWDMKSGLRIRKKLEQLGPCRTDHGFIAKVHDLAPVTADVSKPKLHREAHITYDFRMMGMGGCLQDLRLVIKSRPDALLPKALLHGFVRSVARI